MVPMTSHAVRFHAAGQRGLPSASPRVREGWYVRTIKMFAQKAFVPATTPFSRHPRRDGEVVVDRPCARSASRGVEWQGKRVFLSFSCLTYPHMLHTAADAQPLCFFLDRDPANAGPSRTFLVRRLEFRAARHQERASPSSGGCCHPSGPRYRRRRPRRPSLA